MTDTQSTNYDDVKQYRLDPEREQELVNSAGECVFCWANKAGHPLGVITAYVPVDGKIWMTATRERVRVKAIARDGRSSVVMTSKGTHMGGGKTVTYKGHTVIHDDPETKLWMYKLLASGMAGSRDEGNEFTRGLDPELFVRFLDTPERVVLEFTPEMSIPFDGDKMAQGTAAAYAEFAKEEMKGKSEMSDDLQNYELVSVYKLNPDDQERLLTTQRECVFNWCTKDEWPMGVIMSLLWKDGRAWLTAGAHRHRISAVRRNPKVSVVVTSTGTDMGPGKTITIKGNCIIHEDRETKDWFYPEFASHIRPDESAAFAKMLDSPLRIVLEIVPEKFITYDGAKMRAHTQGTLDESELAQPLEADTKRLTAELKRRGLAD